MNRPIPHACVVFLTCLFSLSTLMAQTTPATTPAKKTAPAAKPDLAKQPTLYVVGYAHLDTEWRWEYPLVIREYLSKTMRENFALFEKYPDYIFNFSGANRYRLMKEYYPDDYKRLQHYVAAGRWFPAGSSMEESDVNSPSAESIFRQVLYGNEFFRRDFGKASAEYMLPDCFGFPSSLPSILAHAGVKGFSTQKLTWGSSAAAGGWDSPERTPEGTPFNVGMWEGPDGHSVIAALNPGSYSADLTTDISKPLPPDRVSTRGHNEQQHALWKYQDDWAARVQHNGEVSGLFTDYHYYGTGDIGGAPTEESVNLLEAILHKGEYPLPPYTGSEQLVPEPGKEIRVGDGPVHVISSAADQMFLDIGNNTARLPRYKGELELTNHSAGSITSEAYQKRWNRKNELLADAAEKASVAAAWLGGRSYPQKRLNDAWTLVMGGQFHDIMAGTATPQSYNYAWNDEVIAMNQFAGVLQDASSTVIAAMETRGEGTPVVVYNPLNIEREDVVTAEMKSVDGTAVRVLGPDGKEVPSQREGEAVLFLAKAPSMGYAVYHVQPGGAQANSSELKATESSLENARYRVQVDKNGDVRSIFDKKMNQEILSAPARLALRAEKPKQWPAWNMDWEDQEKAPRGYVAGPAKMRIVEHGPVRVAIEIEREAEGSKFVQTILLSAGDAGNRVEFANEIDWRTKEAALKATFPLTASNENATYNWDVGTIERPTNTPKKFEMASHQWFDLTDKSGKAGVTVLSDDKYGSDKPDDHTLRLTLIYTPGIHKHGDYDDQATQDFGHHSIVYGLAAHPGDWRQGRTDWQAYRLNQPLIAFVADGHEGPLGTQFSLLHVDNPNVRVLALKKAENSDDVIVRLVETDGRAAKDVHLKFAAPVTAAKEVNGQEMPLAAATVSGGVLATSFTPYELHSFAVKLAPSRARVAPAKWTAVALNYDTSVATFAGKPGEGCMDCSLQDTTADGQGHSLPAEMLPNTIDFDGVRFHIAASSKNDAVIARGQSINLPAGDFNRVYVLAAAMGGDQPTSIGVDGTSTSINIPEWTGFVGQWDNRNWTTHPETVPAEEGSPERIRTVMDFTGQITPGFIKRADIAWYASHRHGTDGSNEAYAYSYLFAFPIELANGAKTLTLPRNEKIRVLAITVANDHGSAQPAQPLYDVLGH